MTIYYPIKTPLMNVMIAAVRKAGRGMIRDFNEVGSLQVSRKGALDFVSEADLKSEKILHAELKKARPSFGFLMEEGGEIIGKNEDFRWVIDPLDGTTNFLHAVPYFAISIALEKTTASGREIVAGIVYDPIHDELFMAEKGEGAFVNSQRLRIATRREDFYFVTGTSRKTSSEYGERASSITRYASGLQSVMRRGGAAALDLAYVAAGRYDACWFPKLMQWDMAAGILLVKEAGGYVHSLSDNSLEDPYETGAIIAASEPAYALLSKVK